MSKKNSLVIKSFPNQNILKIPNNFLRASYKCSATTQRMYFYSIFKYLTSNDNKNVVGLVTDRDILLRSICCDKDAKTTPVSDIMTTNVCCCDANEHIGTAEKIMSDNQIRRIPIIDNDQIVGILSIGDISRNHNGQINYPTA